MSNNNINILGRQADYFKHLMASRAAARNAVNIRGNPIKTRKNRRHGGGNNNGPSVGYFEKLMASRAAKRNEVNIRGNPIKSRKANRKNRKATRKDRKTRH